MLPRTPYSLYLGAITLHNIIVLSEVFSGLQESVKMWVKELMCAWCLQCADKKLGTPFQVNLSDLFANIGTNIQSFYEVVSAAVDMMK